MIITVCSFLFNHFWKLNDTDVVFKQKTTELKNSLEMGMHPSKVGSNCLCLKKSEFSTQFI